MREEKEDGRNKDSDKGRRDEGEKARTRRPAENEYRERRRNMEAWKIKERKYITHDSPVC